jgi:hypothetical protein
MKHYYLMLPLLTALACNAPAQIGPAPATAPATTTPAKPAAFITWDKKLIDLGSVRQGEKRELFFEFTNTAGRDVRIDLVDACACTTTDYPRGTIKPGAKARIDATFDSTEKNASETIDVRVIFTENDEAGNPRVEVVQYKFELVK